MGTSWIAAGVSGGLPKSQRDALMDFFPRLRRQLRPDRAHIVPDHFDWLFESDYDPRLAGDFSALPLSSCSACLEDSSAELFR